MTKLLNWITSNPTSFISIISAIIAASVSLIVFSIGQFLTAKRDRSKFLTPKLEELYLSLNKVSEDNARFFGLVVLALQKDSKAIEELASINDVELYGHATAKRIIMYIRLYFPQLSKIHQLLFAAQRELNQLFFQLHTDKPPKIDDLVETSGRVGHFIKLMEEEIIRNRDHLLKEKIISSRYQHTNEEAIKSESPRPNGPITNLG